MGRVEGADTASYRSVGGSPGARELFLSVPPLQLTLGFVGRSIGQRVAALAVPAVRPRLAERVRRRVVPSVALVLTASGCASLPPRDPATSFEVAAAPAPTGTLRDYAQRIAPALGDAGTAHWLLDRSELALNARLALTDGAAETLDVQYFLWQNDASGKLLALRLLEAASRGVRVRLLLDDFAVSKNGAMVAWLDAHPAIEVRVFNPWASRDSMFGVAVEFLARTKTLNRRMHNKVYIADGQFAIVGGRNIGDRYFGLYEPFVEDDLDVLVAGALVADVSASFDDFWNSPATYPIALLDRRSADKAAAAGPRVAEEIAAAPPQLAAFVGNPTDWATFFDGLLSTFAAGPAALFHDAADPADARGRLKQRLKDLVASAQHEVLISSPYFIPDAEFRDLIRTLVARGVRVAIVTNSLASNNHVVAHTGYKHLRRDVLEAGAELYELRVDAAVRAAYSTPPTEAQAVGLHAKAVVVDGRRTFVGSPNIDPRSLEINTEVGVATESEAFARAVAALIVRDMAPENAWRVTLDADGRLMWSSGAGVVQRQPATGFAQRAVEFLLNLLPLKDQS
jgi:putative cardiolipin synthase